MIRKYIFLATIQSTGTWWAVNNLRTHPHVGGIIHPQNLMNFHNGWVLREGWTGNPHNEGFAQKEHQVTMLYSHYGGTPANFNRWKPLNNYEWLMMVVPTLAPLRDPLICMIRAWHREPPLYPYDYLIDGWVHVAKRDDTFGIHYWRTDPFDKTAFFKAVEGVGLNLPESWVNSLDFNKKVNDTPGECDLRTYYINGDFEAIKKKLPLPVRRLQENEPALRPFLERAGFKDLMWWSK